MPPVMMTKVMPMARNALSATCLEMISTLAADRKLGAAKAKKAKTRIRATNVRIRKSSSSAEDRVAGDVGTDVLILGLPWNGWAQWRR